MNIPLKKYGDLLANYLKPQKGRVAWLAIALLSSIGLQLVNPQILGYFINTAVTRGASPTLLNAALLFIAVAFVTQIFAVTATYLGEQVAWSATNALRVDLVEHCLNLDLSFHKSHTPGELVERVDGDVHTLSRFFSQFTLHVLGNLILLVGILVVLFFEDWRAGVCLSGFALMSLVILLRLRGSAIPPWANYRQISAEFFGFLGEHLAGTEDLRANGAISYVMRRFYQILQRWLPVFHQARFATITLVLTSMGLFSLGNVIALAVGAVLWQQNAITIGTVYLIFYYTNLLNQPIERIREELGNLQQAEASILRIQELLQTRSPLGSGGNYPLPEGALSVSFKNVSFRYESSLVTGHTATRTQAPSMAQSQAQPQTTKDFLPWTLQTISFHLLAGQVLGILGRTGSGKTTIARLLLRLYDPQIGTIHLGNVELPQTPLTHLCQRVGLVTQDVQLFQTTVRNNLTFFDPRISDERILDVLNLLGLWQWLYSLPDGLDTQLQPDSGGLSAGQAQLLAFARIFLKDPGLVILDEASSRLDPVTETWIEHAVDKLLEGRTGVIIAHRLSTVQRADQILILDHGRIVEYGDRETLAHAPNSRFAQLLKTGFTSSTTDHQ
ncbi:ABC transporter ATP-binding protein [Leptolyngbya sp. NK1-12]|uniref:ABC transporter ATP-binding protein n=1 Tax=Leptolyngbya sp. NK1-12 TaxID=2547451 RepID=A0AA97ARY6_9CYAN|nr:ABC transporter ATP-binding protein [Leptolyngbya sp. NK1-12]WNZ26118.1 ABC transporter ATP-binding protein [Leptolyngbya sp. NK1-12]